MNRVKKKSTGKGVPAKKQKHVVVESADEADDSYDSMVDNGTDEDDDDDADYGNDSGDNYDDNESPDSGHESGAFVRAPKPPPSGSKKAKGLPKAIKRKVLAQEDEEAHRKRLKAVKELYKPPTAEEINRLKETENYYHSNLFRMQTEEMLKEVRVPAKVGRFVQVWVEEFKQFLETIEDATTDRPLLKTSYNDIGGFPLPVVTGSCSEHMTEVLSKERFQYVKQRNVRIIGGCGMMRTSFGKPLIVDLLLVMPDKCFHKEDYLNLRYHYKRAHYLCTIAKRLKKPENQQQQQQLVSDVHFELLKGDALKPVLTMTPGEQSFARKVQFRLHAVPEGVKFPKKRFLPDRNNVRPAMIGSGDACTAEEYARFPTPHYNHSILYDLRLAKNSELLEGTIQSDSVREAIVLLKVWARQRRFDRGRYGFDGGLITFYCAYLLQSRRIYPNMSSYQIIRLFWNQLAGSSWEKDGITFDASHRDQLPLFFRFHEVVFLDPLGALNVAANLPIDLYRRVRHESALAIRLLDNRKINSFLPLFLANYPAHSLYDHLVTLNKPPGLIPETVSSFAEEVDRLDYIGDERALFTRLVERLLRKGLGKRVTYLVPLPEEGEGNVKATTTTTGCTIGISINAAEAFNLVDRGPEAIDKEASEEFRAFWTGKAQLRRFKDGSITESCVWGESIDPIGQKRLIVRSIVLFLLEAHLDIAPAHVGYLADQFETVVRPWPPSGVHETVEERSLDAIQAFDALSRIMRDLDGLPLTINAVQGTDAVFRYTDPNPPAPTVVNGEIIAPSKKPMHATIQLEASGKWPDELEAIRRLKTAFYLQIADAINSLNIATDDLPVANAYDDHLFVYFSSYFFRFVIIHQREISILREYLAENKITRLQQDTDESVALEMQQTILPKLTSVLHGLHQQHFSFGSVASIAKRWLYAQLIDAYLWPDECTELLVAALYLNQPLQPPVQPQTGFLRWLQYLASTDWSREMIVVNFNDELSSETVDELEKQFIERRSTFPPLTIVTPCDGGKYGLFGRRAPSVPILNRVTLLAKAAVGLIDPQFDSILTQIELFFQPSFEGYNLIIHLDAGLLTPIGVCSSSLIGNAGQKRGKKRAKNEETEELRDDAGTAVDLAAQYLGELREAYDQFAVFFYDPLGGDRIAVLWRPDALEEKPFTTSNVNGRMLSADGKLQLNVDALVRDFQLLGQGLVKSIERG